MYSVAEIRAECNHLLARIQQTIPLLSGASRRKWVDSIRDAYLREIRNQPIVDRITTMCVKNGGWINEMIGAPSTNTAVLFCVGREFATYPRGECRLRTISQAACQPGRCWRDGDVNHAIVIGSYAINCRCAGLYSGCAANTN